MKNLYTAEVRVTSGRDGHARSSDGHLDQQLGWPKELGGDGRAANPEQLFAAATPPASRVRSRVQPPA